MTSRPRGITAFLLLAFGIAWIPLILQWGLGLRGPDDEAGLMDYAGFVLVTLPTSFAPAIAATLVRKWITREGFSDAGLGLSFRKAWRYYLFAWFYPALVVPMTLALALAAGAGPADFSSLSASAWLQMSLIALVSTPIVWGEEFGWRGYLQIRLLPGRPLLAAIGTGLIWGVWHYPMILMGYIFSGNPLGLLLYPVNMVVTSVLYGWLRARSGTVWTASLAHAAANTVINPVLGLLLPNVEWAVLWAGYRLPVLAVLCIYILARGQLRQPVQVERESPAQAAQHP